jgi:hypothetical protein
MMNIRLEKDLPVLLFALVSASALASLPQVESAWNGVRESYGEQDFGLRFLLEAMLGVIISYAALEPKFWNTLASSKVLGFLTIVASYTNLEIGYVLSLDLPLVMQLAGLQVFEYLPLALIGLTIGKSGAGESVLARFAHYLHVYVAPEGLLAITHASVGAAPIRRVDFRAGSLRYPYYGYAYAAIRT